MRQNKHQRLPAFTIMEVTIAMLVAAIVIGMTYTAYTIISKSFIDFKAKNEGIALLARIDHVMKRDFDRAVMIEVDDTGITMINNNQLPVHYEIMPSYILRKTSVADTFKVQSRDINMFFEKREKNEMTANTNLTSAELNRIDELSFAISYKNDLIPFHFIKKYSAVNLINRNPHAIN